MQRQIGGKGVFCIENVKKHIASVGYSVASSIVVLIARFVELAISYGSGGVKLLARARNFLVFLLFFQIYVFVYEAPLFTVHFCCFQHVLPLLQNAKQSICPFCCSVTVIVLVAVVKYSRV